MPQQTLRTRSWAKLQEVNTELQRRRHPPLPKVWAQVRSVIQGHVRYYGVLMNGPALHAFRRAVSRLWKGFPGCAFHPATSALGAGGAVEGNRAIEWRSGERDGGVHG